jgi:mRNA interferase RelE/StbE
MKVELSPKAAKYLTRLNEPIKGRIKIALHKLSNEPPQGDIKAMSGQDGYRLRIGGYRILFGIKDNKIVIIDIGLRGQIYKGVK